MQQENWEKGKVKVRLENKWNKVCNVVQHLVALQIAAILHNRRSHNMEVRKELTQGLPFLYSLLIDIGMPVQRDVTWGTLQNSREQFTKMLSFQMSISKMIKHPLIRLFLGSWHINISYHALGRSSLCREAWFSHLRWEVGDQLELCRLPTSQSQNRTSVSDVLDSDSLEGESVDRSSWFLLDLYEGCEYQNIYFPSCNQNYFEYELLMSILEACPTIRTHYNQRKQNCIVNK